MTVNTTPQIIVTRRRLRCCLAVIVACTLCFAGSSRALGGEAKGTLNFKGTTLVLKFAYLVKGPDAVDPSTQDSAPGLFRDRSGPEAEGLHQDELHR